MHELCARGAGSKPDDGRVAAALHRFRSAQCSLQAALAQMMGWAPDSADGAAFVELYKRAVLERVGDSVTALSGATAMLDELVTYGVKIAIFTNGWTQLQKAKAAAIGFPGPVIVSEEIGAWKPDPAAFQRAAFMLAFPLEATVYVGDSPLIDVAGAKAAGMRAVWVNLDAKPYPAGAVAPDAMITRLCTLPEVIACEDLKTSASA